MVCTLPCGVLPVMSKVARQPSGVLATMTSGSARSRTLRSSALSVSKFCQLTRGILDQPRPLPEWGNSMGGGSGPDERAGADLDIPAAGRRAAAHQDSQLGGAAGSIEISVSGACSSRLRSSCPGRSGNRTIRSTHRLSGCAHAAFTAGMSST
jgi:hypothetical protein